MKRVALVLEYDGTDFAGWQLQPNARTVQGIVEDALQTIEGRPVRVHGSGRTDSGVHAVGQVAHCDVVFRASASTLRRALNASLPFDVRVVAAREVPDTFHARMSAVQKHYRYRIWNAPVARTMARRTEWFVPMKLDVDAMRRALAAFVGEHDFRAFYDGPTQENSMRVLRRVELVQHDAHRMECWVSGNGFLKHMVRVMVGTVFDVGRGARAATDVERLLVSGTRAEAGPTAPPQGLTLMAVEYPADALVRTDRLATLP